jgi:hypothetical protein
MKTTKTDPLIDAIAEYIKAMHNVIVQWNDFVKEMEELERQRKLSQPKEWWQFWKRKKPVIRYSDSLDNKLPYKL